MNKEEKEEMAAKFVPMVNEALLGIVTERKPGFLKEASIPNAAASG